MRKFEELNIFMYIDALPLEYINPNYTPYLYKFITAGSFYILENIPGYSFGIQSAILSGKLPQDTLHWMPYIFKTERKVFHSLHSMYIPLLRRAPLHYLEALRQTDLQPLKYTYQFMLCNPLLKHSNEGVKLCGTPLSLLDDILIYPYYYMNENPFFLMLKKELEHYNISVVYMGHSLSNAVEILRLTKKETDLVSKESARLILFIYIDNLDGVGHSRGIETPDWLNVLRAVDVFLYLLYKRLNSISYHTNLIVFSDHGMCNADEYIDIENLFLRYFPRNSIQYIIDATLAFIRVNRDDSNTKDLMVKVLERKLHKKVMVLDTELHYEELKQNGVHFANREYGDIIIQAKPCKEFFPNFYSITNKLIGLHGFWPNEPVQQAFIVSLIREKDPCKNPSHIKDIKHYILCQSTR